MQKTRANKAFWGAVLGLALADAGTGVVSETVESYVRGGNPISFSCAHIFLKSAAPEDFNDPYIGGVQRLISYNLQGACLLSNQLQSFLK